MRGGPRLTKRFLPEKEPLPATDRADRRTARCNQTLSKYLELLYGDVDTGELAGKLTQLLKRWQPHLDGSQVQDGKSKFDEKDVLLIAYADQVTEPGQIPLRTLGRLCRQHIGGMVTGIHLLPFYPWSSDDGFSVKDFTAVEAAYGTWEDIADLGRDFDLMFDAVFNHVSAQGKWFQSYLADAPRYRDFFISVEGTPDLSKVVRPRALPLLTEFSASTGLRKVWTTFSSDQVDLNFKNPEVLLAILDTLLFYVSRGARYIRLDAIAFLWKEIGTSCLHLPQTHQIIQLLRAVLEKVAPRVLLITETNVPHAENISYFGDGTNEAHLVYNFALPPLVLHSVSASSAEKLTRWAQSLELPSTGVTFFNFLASHDGIGLNPARGILSDEEMDGLVKRTLTHGGLISYKTLSDGSEVPYELNISYLDALSNPLDEVPQETLVGKCLLAHAVLLSLQGVPGIYFHSMFGSRGKPEAVLASGIPRRINREKLSFIQLEMELAQGDSIRAKILAAFRELLGVRREHPAFAPSSLQRVLEVDARVFAVLRQSQDGTDTVLCLHNFSGDYVAVRLSEAVPEVQAWKDLRGNDPSPPGRDVRLLDPYGVSWLVVVESYET
jgi:glycosidase